MDLIDEIKDTIKAQLKYARLIGETDNYVCFEVEKIESLITQVEKVHAQADLLREYRDKIERYENALQKIASHNIMK